MANDGNCTCNVSKDDIQKEIESVDVVFFGKVGKVEQIDYFYINEFYDDTIQDVKFKYTFEVEKSIKDNPKQQLSKYLQEKEEITAICNR